MEQSKENLFFAKQAQAAAQTLAKIQNSGLSGVSDTPLKKGDAQITVKSGITNPIAEVMPNTHSYKSRSNVIDLFEMFVDGHEFPGLHVSYAAANSPVKKLGMSELKNTGERVSYVTSPANCPWPVVTRIKGKWIYLFGAIPEGDIVETRYVSWNKIQELVTAFAQTKKMITDRRDAINRARAAQTANQPSQDESK